MRGAAFFDLDRTLVRSASGAVFGKALRDLGVVTRRLPAESLIYGSVNVFGESLPSIALARQATLVARGRPEDAFDEAAALAVESLLPLVGPFADPVIRAHREAGRPVVLATTTPHHLVAPLAEALGFDDVIATRYAVRDGRFTGGLEGPFVWSMGKLGAAKAWARENGVRLKDSYAYSDSIYDLPLLSAVGMPHAVNPDPRLLGVALLRRWPIVNFDVSPGVFKLPLVGMELQRALMLGAHGLLHPYVRFDSAGHENVPAEGPAILVGNHRSYFDVTTMLNAMLPTGRTGRFLAKKELFDVPVVGPLWSAIGGIPVDRGRGGDGPLQAGVAALAAGEIVGLMPQGTIPRGEEFFAPVLKGHTGAARLAAMTRAPVIPVGIWGTERVWPRSSPVPNMTTVLTPPTVRVRFGEPVELKYRSPRRDTERIMAAILDLLPPEARELHAPTEKELRRATPGVRAARSGTPGRD